MFGFGGNAIFDIVLGIIVIYIVFSRLGSGRTTGPTLVLRKLEVNEKPINGYLVDIEGRSSGLIAWFLTVIGFDTVSTLQMTVSEITLKTSSLFGQMHVVTPLTRVAHTRCGYSKPIGFFIIGTLVILQGVFALFAGHGSSIAETNFLTSLVIGGGCLIAYWVLKSMTIAIETSGGTLMGLKFKRSVIENVSVDIDKVHEAIRLINNRIVEVDSIKSANITPVTSKTCPKCGSNNGPADMFCPECGTQLS